MRRLIVLPLLSMLAGCMMTPPVPQPIPVFFPNASTALDAQGRQAVALAANLSKQYPKLHISLIGYRLPGAAGIDDGHLGADRAASVRNELMQDGIPAARIIDSAGGPLNAPPQSAVKSRRVDISFTR